MVKVWGKSGGGVDGHMGGGPWVCAFGPVFGGTRRIGGGGYMIRALSDLREAVGGRSGGKLDAHRRVNNTMVVRSDVQLLGQNSHLEGGGWVPGCDGLQGMGLHSDSVSQAERWWSADREKLQVRVDKCENTVGQAVLCLW